MLVQVHIRQTKAAPLLSTSTYVQCFPILLRNVTAISVTTGEKLFFLHKKVISFPLPDLFVSEH
jgi:hypothetical protein